MKVLLLGASGATGRLVVQQLLNRNIRVKIVVRKIEKVAIDFLNNKLLECIVGNITEFDKDKNMKLINDCDAVVSCLGHNISFKGLFGKPRLLVKTSIRNICEAIEEMKNNKVKLILMNTTANCNKKANEKYSFADRMVLSLLNILLPPQKDNVRAALYLSNNIEENNSLLEWTVIRPDTLLNEEKESEYEISESPKRSPVFNAGKTSRVNVSRFIVELLLNEELWAKWKFKMPVIYNK
ncbi:MAG: NAD(P)-dependent oxidoreductase [Ignavibacteriae bacterium]|nr:MAG: NAD(P)-dependent oxidoreductase [Ignavibacteriota bacterium]